MPLSLDDIIVPTHAEESEVESEEDADIGALENGKDLQARERDGRDGEGGSEKAVSREESGGEWSMKAASREETYEESGKVGAAFFGEERGSWREKDGGEREEQVVLGRKEDGKEARGPKSLFPEDVVPVTGQVKVALKDVEVKKPVKIHIERTYTFEQIQSTAAMEEYDHNEESFVRKDDYDEQPDAEFLSQCTNKDLTREELNELKWWAYLVVGDRFNPKTWSMPVRDRLGRLNRPLVQRARTILTSEERVNRAGIVVSRNTLMRAIEFFEQAWPGAALPTNFVRPLDDVNEHCDMVRSTTALLREAKAVEAKLDFTQHQENVVVVVSDVAPNLLMKIRAKKASAIQASRPMAPPPARALPKSSGSSALSRQKMLLQFSRAAQLRLSTERERKSIVRKQVDEQYEALTKKPKSSDVALKQKDEADESEDEPYDPDGSGSSSEEEESNYEMNMEDEVARSAIEAGDEEEFMGATKDNIIVEKIIVVAAESDEAAEASVEALSDSEHTNKENGNKNKNDEYRKMLERDIAKSKVRPSAFLENEASEEEDDDAQPGKVKEHVLGLDNVINGRRRKDDDDETRDMRITAEDLEGIVDTVSDDEGNGDASDLYQKQMNETDEAMLKRVKRDLENHTLIDRRRRLNGTRLDRALEDGASDSETDEELDQAREERYQAQNRERLAAIQAGSGCGKSFLGETAQDVLDEAEQSKQFLEKARMQKIRRSSSLVSNFGSSFSGMNSQSSQGSRVSTSTPYGFDDQVDPFGGDEDSRMVLECLRNSSASQLSLPAMNNENTMSAFSMNDLSNHELSMSAILKSESTLGGASGAANRKRTVWSGTAKSQVVKKIVYTSSNNNNSVSSSLSSQQASSTDSAASSSTSPTASQTMPSSQRKAKLGGLMFAQPRRVALAKVSIHKLAAAHVFGAVSLAPSTSRKM